VVEAEEMLEDYQNAAEIIVQLIYGAAIIATLAGGVAAIRFLWHKRVRRTRETNVSQD